MRVCVSWQGAGRGVARRQPRGGEAWRGVARRALGIIGRGWVEAARGRKGGVRVSHALVGLVVSRWEPSNHGHVHDSTQRKRE